MEEGEREGEPEMGFSYLALTVLVRHLAAGDGVLTVERWGYVPLYVQGFLYVRIAGSGESFLCPILRGPHPPRPREAVQYDCSDRRPYTSSPRSSYPHLSLSCIVHLLVPVCLFNWL